MINPLPTLAVRVAFGSSSPYTDSPTWSTLVASDIRSITIKRGRFYELNRLEAGTVNIELNNVQGNYWSNNTSGLYYPNVLPLKRVNVRATYGGNTYDLATAFTESWTPGFMGLSGKGPIINLTASDIIKPLSRVRLNNAGYVAELSGARIGNVLDDAGWNATERAIAAGQSTMQATGANVNANAMDHLFAVQDSESGLLFQRGDGYIVFLDRYSRIQSPYTTSQGTFSDTPGNLSYQEFTPSYDDQLIYNDIRYTRTGGTEQVASDATSQNAYGLRSLPKSGLLNNSDTDCLNLANHDKACYKDPYFRIKNITIIPPKDPASLWPCVLGFEIGTRITVQLSIASVDEDYYIEAITHYIDCVKNTWRTIWELRPVNLFADWIIGISELGINTRLSF